ncbi:cytochrome P450 [Ceratobasidium sp. AG-I]|nr:cytochrome P450 [Ceratobasidium sp. AG-I]
MSHSQQPSEVGQLEIWLGLLIERIHLKPAESFVIAASVAFACLIIKRLTTASFYQNIDGPDNGSLIYGHLHDIFSPAGLPFHDNLQDTYGSVSKVQGLLGIDQLYISDPRVVHEILVKEHETAFRHPQFFYEHFSIMNLSFGPGLLATSGEVHKVQRKMLNPVFTAKHMKALTAKFEGIAQDLKTAMINDIGDFSSKDLDMLKWCSTTALELIGQAGKSYLLPTCMGHTFGIFQGAESPYNHAIKSYIPAVFALLPYRFLMPLVYNLRPAGLRRKIVEWTPDPNVQKLKEIIDIQDEQLSDQYFGVVRANMNTAEQNRLPEDQLLGQMNGALARVLHLLSLNPDIQDRLRDELNAAPPSVDYNELHSLEYLDAVCRELLRLYPPVTTIEREALKDSVVPLRMTFSAGPRACIGFKFSLLELKIVLSMLLKSFKFTPASVPVQWCLGSTMVPYEVGVAEENKRPGLPLHTCGAV